MFSNDFEDAFSQFLETAEYDEAENYLFSMAPPGLHCRLGGRRRRPAQRGKDFSAVPRRREGKNIKLLLQR